MTAASTPSTATDASPAAIPAHPNPAERHFDLIIVGTGSGNSILDERYDGLSVAVCEEGRFGGTCLNVGCIPTKMFVYAADRAEAFRTSEEVNVSGTYDAVHWPALQQRIFLERIDKIAAGGENYRRNECSHVEVFGHAEFVGERRLRVELGGGQQPSTGDFVEITADQVVLAAGARPSVPAPVRESGVSYETNETIMRLPELPEHLIILGSGYIATEFAHVFSEFGTKVTLIGRSPRLLKHLDDEVAEYVTEAVRDRWDLRLGTATTGFSQEERDGVTYTTVTFEDGSSVTGDAFLVATGRTPNGDRLNAAAGGVELDHTRVVVDDYGRTTAPGVWSLGDLSSPYQLKHVANHEQRAVQHNVLRGWEAADTDLWAFDHRVVPAAVFTSPQVASAGLTEAQAREKAAVEGFEVSVKVQNYSDVAYGWAMNATEERGGIVKLIAVKGTGELLGAWIAGHEASLLIQPLVQAMSFGLHAPEMARGQYWIHPALTEVVENALLGLE